MTYEEIKAAVKKANKLEPKRPSPRTLNSLKNFMKKELAYLQELNKCGDVNYTWDKIHNLSRDGFVVSRNQFTGEIVEISLGLHWRDR